jgi:Ca2+-binding EF-hand superfamily protein
MDNPEYFVWIGANPDGIFITENLTSYRTTLTERLAQLKFDKLIQAYWTSDGRIFVNDMTSSSVINGQVHTW